MALNSLSCADVLLSNYSLTHSPQTIPRTATVVKLFNQCNFSVK